MSRFRDFDAARAERAAEPLRFKLGGEMFETNGDIPAGILLDAAAAMHDDDDAKVGMFVALFDGIVSEDDKDRFAAAVRRVDLATVIELVQWILEEVTGRPLPNASPSLAGLSTNGVSWTASSPSPGATPSP